MKRSFSLCIFLTILLISIGGASTWNGEFLTGEDALNRFKNEVVPKILIPIAEQQHIKEKLDERGETAPVYDVMTFAYQQAIKRINLRRGFITREYGLLAPPGTYVEYLQDEIIFQLCLWSFIPWCPKEANESQRLAKQVRTAGMVNALGNYLLSLAFKDAYFEANSQQVSQWVEIEKEQRLKDYVNIEAFYRTLAEIKQEFKKALEG